jgi:hypothetical protein
MTLRAAARSHELLGRDVRCPLGAEVVRVEVVAASGAASASFNGTHVSSGVRTAAALHSMAECIKGPLVDTARRG